MNTGRASLPLSYIELSREAFENNISEFRKKLPKDVSLVAVVKANAYGHGIKETVSLCDGVDGFQVDDIEELREVRALTTKPIFVLGYIAKADLEEALSLDATCGVYNLDTLKLLSELAEKTKREVKIHLKIDALLGRQGILPSDTDVFFSFLKEHPLLRLEAVYSHFSNIEDAEGLDHAKKQYGELMAVKKKAEELGFSLAHHVSATSGFLSDMKDNWGGSCVRLGIGLYGLWPSERLKKNFEKEISLKPVCRLVTHIAQVKKVPAGFPVGYGLTYITQKPMTLAVIPLGYSDGLDRALSNKGFALIQGTRCPLVGRVAMNMCVADVTHLLNVESEEEVVLLGHQKGENIGAEEIAEKTGTINYEVMARLSGRLPRVIVSSI